MKKHKKTLKVLAVALVASLGLSLAGCLRSGEAIDPGQWGYSVNVQYHALGGVINEREVRNTSYLPDSLIFQPSGTSGMMVQPVKDGYVLAGWYRNVTEVPASDDDYDDINDDGQPVTYEFDAQDRWDFNTDRASEDLTLYARWIRQGVANYVHADTGEVMFTKNITAASPVQELSSSILRLISGDDDTFSGYYEDSEMSTPFDFDVYEHIPLVPTLEMVWTQLAEEFPQYFVEYDYVSPTPGVVETDAAGEELEPDANVQTEDTSLLFLHQMGWDIPEADNEAVMDEIRTRKNEIYELYIQGYVENTADSTVYLGFAPADSIIVRTPEDLLVGRNYGFLDESEEVTYVFEADIDMSGLSFTMAENFKGSIEGNGYTLSNVEMPIRSPKRDFAEYIAGALFNQMEGASVSDLTISNLTIDANLGPEIDADLAAFAISASDTTISNVHLENVTITTGRGDNGLAQYRVSDSFMELDGGSIEEFTVTNLTVEASDDAEVILNYSE